MAKRQAMIMPARSGEEMVWLEAGAGALLEEGDASAAFEAEVWDAEEGSDVDVEPAVLVDLVEDGEEELEVVEGSASVNGFEAWSFEVQSMLKEPTIMEPAMHWFKGAMVAPTEQ